MLKYYVLMLTMAMSIRGRIEEAHESRTRGERGLSSLEIAAIALVLLAVAGLVSVAFKAAVGSRLGKIR